MRYYCSSFFPVVTILFYFFTPSFTFSYLSITPKSILKLQLSLITTISLPEETTVSRVDDEESDYDTYKSSGYRQTIPLEYLTGKRREYTPSSPFHILLLDTMFDSHSHNPATTQCVSSILMAVLQMPLEQAEKSTKHTKNEGISCLGTWRRMECLTLARHLQLRGLDVRVVPFHKGGIRKWQGSNHFVLGFPKSIKSLRPDKQGRK